MDEPLSTYYIERAERLNDAQRTVTAGLLVGSAPECELWLNHPAVSRVQAGINRVGEWFYVTALSASNTTSLNGRALRAGAAEALADGDVLQLGPFALEVDYASDGLRLRVSQQPGQTAADAPAGAQAQPTGAPEALPASVAEAMKNFWAERKRELAAPSTLLHPQQPRATGKAGFAWEPTLDLRRNWPVAVFFWAVLLCGGGLWAAARWYPQAYAPRPVSTPHARAALNAGADLARQPNADACTTCHARPASIEDNCTSCHQATRFVATVTPPHRQHQVGCTTCHAEHRGREFSPREAALHLCADCHKDGNVYQGARMKTPHPRTGFGYPVLNGQWVWSGLDEEEWATKPAKVRAELNSWPMNTERERLIAQFHALHVYRVRSVAGLRANEEGEMECSTCHEYIRPTADAEMPRKHCELCHDGRRDEQTGRVLLAADEPNCTSCHVQHVRDQRHWNAALLVETGAGESKTEALKANALKNETDAARRRAANSDGH
ncbi:MAG TPA: FHA domain-containing protein [Pyrinomonadaceae bacterium]|jgi:hypothetical protein